MAWNVIRIDITKKKPVLASDSIKMYVYIWDWIVFIAITCRPLSLHRSFAFLFFSLFSVISLFLSLWVARFFLLYDDITVVVFDLNENKKAEYAHDIYVFQ